MFEAALLTGDFWAGIRSTYTRLSMLDELVVAMMLFELWLGSPLDKCTPIPCVLLLLRIQQLGFISTNPQGQIL